MHKDGSVQTLNIVVYDHAGDREDV